MARTAKAPAAGKRPALKGLERQAKPIKRQHTTAISPYPFVLLFCGAGGTSSYYATDQGVLPCLRTQPLMSGVNGVVQKKDGSYDLNGLVENCAEAGAWILPDWEDYCVEVEGGYAPAHLTDGQGRIVRQRDADAAYADWLRGLVEDGTLPAPSADDLEAVADRLRDLDARARKEYAAALAQGQRVDLIDVLARRITAAEAEAAAARAVEEA